MQTNASEVQESALNTSACSICGTVNRASAGFCRCCGVSITRTSLLSESNEQGTAFCSSCQRPHSLPARFCDLCGGKLSHSSWRAAKAPEVQAAPASASAPAKRKDGSESADAPTRRAAQAAISEIFHGAPAKVTVFGGSPQPEDAAAAADSLPGQPGCRPEPAANMQPAGKQAANRQSFMRHAVPAVLLAGASAFILLGVVLSEQEKELVKPTLTAAMPQEDASASPINQDEKTAVADLRSVRNSNPAAQLASLTVPAVRAASSPTAGPVAEDAPPAVSDQLGEPGFLLNGSLPDLDMPLPALGHPVGSVEQWKRPARKAAPAVSRPPKPVVLSSAEREINYEPVSEIRIRPPLPLIEFKSVVRLDSTGS